MARNIVGFLSISQICVKFKDSFVSKNACCKSICLDFFFFQGIDKQDETATNAASKKKADSDSEDEEQDTQQKDTGVSNKKKKVLE